MDDMTEGVGDLPPKFYDLGDDLPGLNVVREGSPAFDVYDIRLPPHSFFTEVRDDGLLDMFTFCIMGIENVIAGTVMLFDVGQRLQALPEMFRKMWEDSLAQANYAILLQVIPSNEWHTVARCASLAEAKGAFIDWLASIGPGKPVTVAVPRGTLTLWSSPLPGIRTVQELAVQTPYTTITHLN